MMQNIVARDLEQEGITQSPAHPYGTAFEGYEEKLLGAIGNTEGESERKHNISPLSFAGTTQSGRTTPFIDTNVQSVPHA